MERTEAAPVEHESLEPAETARASSGTNDKGHEKAPIPVKAEKTLVAGIKDHFSLLMPSSTVEFVSNSGAHVFELEDGQIVLEEDKKHEIIAKQMEDKTTGATLLRLTYTVVTAFWTGFLFVFSLQVLLFLTLDLVSLLQATVCSGSSIRLTLSRT